MDLEQLTIFITVAKFEHMTKAADSLNISQSAVSQSISRLEAELGVSLFDRVGRGLLLNKYGSVFLRESIEAIEHISAGKQALRELQDMDKKTLTLITPTWFGFPALIEKIHHECPDARIVTFNCGTDQVAHSLKNGKADLCIYPTTISDPEINSVELRHEAMGIIVSDKHPLFKAGHMDISVFADAGFAAFSSGASQRINSDAFCAELGWQQRVIFETDNYAEIVRAVSTGKYVAAVVSSVYKNYKQNDISFLCPPNLSVDVSLRLYWTDRSLNRPPVRILRDIIMEHFGVKYQGFTDSK